QAASEHYGVLRSILGDGDAEGRRAQVLETLKQSGLRGMGGAGFPAGLKWELTAKAKGTPKYVVCNADESEPGTFKDRVILEELPHLMIEGMVLGAWVVGAHEAIIYLRHEYGREKKALQRALEDARAAGVIGGSVLGSGYACDLRLFVSPGGYILGGDTRLQKIFLFVGPRRSGKGTIGRVLTGLLGSHNVAAPTMAGIATNFGLAPLIGKPLGLISDARLSGRTDGQVVVERLLTISGEDSLTIDRKYKEPWTGQLPTRFVILTNELTSSPIRRAPWRPGSSCSC
ncbi:MAG: hypothetical protein IH848_03240, partial [Acidobacteria bacterium]|nr:hypothetical protein [Acidobacteriota bacterium]